MDLTDNALFDLDDIKLEDIEPWQADHVGAELAAARRTKGVTVETLASDLKIRAAFITALEAGRYSDLPGLPYAIGYVRSIADHLGLDGNAVVRTFKEQQAHNYVAPALTLREPEVPDERGAPKALLVAISIVLGTLGYGGWLLLSPPDAGPPDDLIAAPASPAPTKRVAETRKKATGTATAALREPTAAPKTDGRPEDRATNAGPTRVETIAPAAATISPPPAAKPKPKPPALANAAIVLEARGLTWVQLTDASGATLVAGAKTKGWRYTLPDKPGLHLTVGRANQLVILVGDRTLPPLAKDSRAVRNLPLDPGKLKQQASASTH